VPLQGCVEESGPPTLLLGSSGRVMESAERPPPAAQETVAQEIEEGGLIIIKNHPLLPKVKDFLIKHNFPTVENGVVKGVLNLDFFPDIVWSPPNPTLLSNPKIMDFYWGNTRVIIWAPDVFRNKHCPGGKIPCPRCKSAMGVGSDGWESDLRLVHGIGCVFLIYAKRYRCKECVEARREGNGKSTSFNGLNPVSLTLLHPFIGQQLPFKLTYRGALHRPLVDLVDRNVLNGKSFLDEQDTLKELAYLNYHRAQLLSLSYEDAMQKLRKEGMLKFMAPKPLEPFSSFSDPEGYRGRFPSAGYLVQVYKEECKER
jgi:hypothetical protein